MSEKRIAKIAVSAATYWTDRPYDYNVPAAFAERVKPGVRVIVPFSRGNRKCEGIVLSVVTNIYVHRIGSRADTICVDLIRN